MSYDLKMSQQGYSKIERGDKEIKIARLEQITKLLGVKVEDILTLEDSKYLLLNNVHIQLYRITFEVWDTLKTLAKTKKRPWKKGVKIQKKPISAVVAIPYYWVTEGKAFHTLLDTLRFPVRRYTGGLLVGNAAVYQVYCYKRGEV